MRRKIDMLYNLDLFQVRGVLLALTLVLTSIGMSAPHNDSRPNVWYLEFKGQKIGVILVLYANFAGVRTFGNGARVSGKYSKLGDSITFVYTMKSGEAYGAVYKSYSGVAKEFYRLRNHGKQLLLIRATCYLKDKNSSKRFIKNFTYKPTRILDILVMSKGNYWWSKSK